MPHLLVDHVGIVNKREEDATEFYQNLLGLEKVRESSVAPELSRQLFNLCQEIKMLVFGGEGVKIEVFIISGYTPPIPPVSHFCLQIRHFSDILKRLNHSEAVMITGQHGSKTVYFTEDFSGNRIEIKPLSP